MLEGYAQSPVAVLGTLVVSRTFFPSIVRVASDLEILFSEFTQDKKVRQQKPDLDSEDEDDQAPEGAPMSPPASPQLGEASSSKVKMDRKNSNDPLAEFYAEARAQAESGVSAGPDLSTIYTVIMTL